ARRRRPPAPCRRRLPRHGRRRGAGAARWRDDRRAARPRAPRRRLTRTGPPDLPVSSRWSWVRRVMPAIQDERLLTTLKAVAAQLRGADVPFALAGGLAAWARGGPPTEKDIDLLIREADGERALEALAAAGF